MNKKLTLAIIFLAPVFTTGAQSDFDVEQLREDIALVGNTDYGGEAPDLTDLKTGYIPFDYHNTVTGNSPWRKTPRGMLVIGTGDTLRAIDRFSGTAQPLPPDFRRQRDRLVYAHTDLSGLLYTRRRRRQSGSHSPVHQKHV